MSTNNVNIVNTNNWYQKMNTNGNQNVTNMVLSGTNPSTQMTLINSASDVHYVYSNYPISSVNGFTMSFQFYISGTASNLIRLNAFFGTLDYNVGNNLNGQGGVQVLINPGGYTYGGEGNGHQLQIVSAVVSGTWPATSNNTAVTAGAWQTVSVTFNPSGTTGNWVVSYNGTTVMTYNHSSNVYGYPIGQNSTWGIGATNGGTPATVFIRNVDFSVKHTMPMSILKNTYSFYPEECFINKLSTHSQTNAAAAFGLRLLKADYLGPIINIRRGSDNATLDFYADSKGNIGTSLYGTGQTLLTWLNNSIGYVTRWYDQTGNGRDVIQSTTSAQPKIGTPILDTMSSAGKSAARGIYALYSANSSYTGATIKLRRSSDNATSDFYSDVYGNLNNSLSAENTVNTWTARTSNLACQGIAWSPSLNLFAATNYNGGAATTSAIQTSPDGITWTTRTTPSITLLANIVWAPELSLFVATSYLSHSTSAVITSPDGINWTSRTTPTGGGYGWNDLVWSGSLFVCVSQNGIENTRWVMTSPDGINWTSRTTPSGSTWIGVSWSQSLGLFVAVNNNTSTTSAVATSPDGITWTIRTTPSVSGMRRVRWSPGLNLFVAVGTNVAITSPDGINWTIRSVPSGSWGGLVWSPELSIFAATRSDISSTNCIMTSSDGITWTSRVTPSTRCWDIAWSPSLSTFVAVNILSTTLITSAQGLIANSTYNTWISTSTSYVDTWYDQSGSGNHATQSTTSFQPVYNGTLKLIDSLNSSSLFLNMPSGTVPTGTLNAPYSFVFRHGTVNNSTNGTFISAGIWSVNQSNIIRADTTIGYFHYWNSNDVAIGTSSQRVTGNTVSVTYNGALQNGYINNTLTLTNSSRTGVTTAAGQQYLFRAPGGEYLNGQMYSVFIFGSALSDSDRIACTGNPTDLNIRYDGSASNLYIGATNFPLTSGLKNYTYIFSGRIDSHYGVIVEQASIPLSNNTRSALYAWLPTQGYGFVGHNNDTYPNGIIPYATFVNRKIVMMCNHNLSSGNVVTNDNGSIYTATSTSPSTLNVGIGSFNIGRNGNSGEYYTGNINEIIVFKNTLTPKESQIYFTPNAITRKNYRSQPRLQIKDVPKDIGSIPAGAVVALDTQMLANMSPGGLVTSWNGFTGFNNPVINAGISGTGIHYTIPPYVSLTNNNVSASLSTGQYLNAGNKTFNINTNGGFTAIWYGAFTGSANNHERIFDFGSGTSNNILAGRNGTTSSIYFYLNNGGTAYNVLSGNNMITQNEWAVWTFRYTASSRYMEIIKNGILYSTGTAGAAITDRTLSNTWIGRSNWTQDTYSSINTAGLYVYASYLTDAQVASVSNHLMYCTTSSMPSALPDYNNKVVRYGSLLSQGFRNGQAMYFNGFLGSYLDIQDVPNYPLTFSFWFNQVNAYNYTNISPAALCSADLAGAGIQFDMDQSGTRIVAAYWNSSINAYSQFTNSTVALNTWYHIAFTVTPTTAAYYLNGSLVQSVSTVLSNTNRIIIGKSGDNARPYNGYIQDIRVFDYALRADEISHIYVSVEERALTNYNAPTNYLVNMSNWYSIMDINKTGTFNIVSMATAPNIQYRLTSNGVANSSNTVFNSTRIQNYNSFTCSFENWSDTVTDHGFYFYCGATSSTTVPTGTAGTAANSSYYIYFQVTGTRGIYLFNDQGQQLAYSPLPNVITNQVYTPITIVYNRSTTNTWTVNVASNDILTYNDPNNANWVSNIAGDFWGIGARTTTSGMSSYVRRLELSYTPFVNSINTVVNAQNNTKFPPLAMTAASTTFTGTSILDGVYTATASNSAGTGINPYSAFDNNTSTYWGELNSYAESGVYTGGVSTSVKNLVNNITTSYSGEWLQIQAPNAVTLNSFGLMGRQDNSLFLWRTPATFYIAGSNDNSTWELVHSTSGAAFTSAMQYFTCNANNPNKYRYFRIITSRISNPSSGGANGPGGPTIDIAAWDLYTQMNTVNAGLVAVPPYSMTANTTTFSGNSIYDGTYTLTASNSTYQNLNTLYVISNDAYGTVGNIFSPGAYYDAYSGVYTGSTSTTVSGVTQSGEWVQMQIPNPIVLYSFSLNFWWGSNNYWSKSFLLAGSNDNSTWTNIYDNTNGSFTYSTAQTFVITGSPNAYRYFRLIVRSTSGIYGADFWFLDQWKLYTNASNFNLMKFPPAPLTADSPVTFTTVNAKNWYNLITVGTNSGFTPTVTGTDPFKQIQLTDSSGGNQSFNFANQPVMNYNSFTLTFQLICYNTGNGDYINLYFGSGGYSQTFSFQIYYYNGIIFNGISSPTNWFNSTWNDIRVVYNRGPTNTWTMFFNETQIIQYSDPNWGSAPGSDWGFYTFNGAARFTSYLRQFDMTINPVSIPGNSVLNGSYIASASSYYNNALSDIPSNAFNGKGGVWHTAMVNSAGTYTNGAYTGSYTTTVSGTSYSGEWLQLQTPNPLQLVSFGIYPRQDSSLFQRRSPRNFVMAGSNNGSTWDLLHTATGISDWTSAEKYFVCNGSNVASKYSYFRLIVIAVGNPNPGTGDFANITNLNLYTPMSLGNSITPATPKGLLDGLTWKYYDGDSGNNVSHYTTNTYRNIGRCIDTTNINTLTSGQHRVNGGDYYSMEIFGYFRASVSGTYTFYLATDDGSYLWIGNNALVGYTTSNANIQHASYNAFNPISCTVTLLAGTYYPIRIHWTEGGGGDDLRFSFTLPGGTQTSNGQGFFFSGTGLDSAFPQENAKIIKDLTGTNTDGVYYILVNGISTPIHCLMNDCYDGGGWMILMKGTRGTTFQYSANYWTSRNTLNAADLTRSDADAKYDTFNYSTVKDVLAIFPDIPSTSYTNPYGQNGGSIFVSDGWTWMVNNWNETTRITPFTGFTTSRFPHQNSSSATQTYGINNPFRYNGYGTWCSNQGGAYLHGFNRSGTSGGASPGPYIRWGFLFNNESDLSTCDCFCGIGVGGYGDMSAGDRGTAAGTVGINRTARFEMYGR